MDAHLCCDSKNKRVKSGVLDEDRRVLQLLNGGFFKIIEKDKKVRGFLGRFNRTKVEECRYQ